MMPTWGINDLLAELSVSVIRFQSLASPTTGGSFQIRQLFIHATGAPVAVLLTAFAASVWWTARLLESSKFVSGLHECLRAALECAIYSEAFALSRTSTFTH
jgi:hypothetical protein